MNRQIRALRRNLEKPRLKGCEPFDRYAFNAFACQAKYWAVYGKTEEERVEAGRLHGVAVARSQALLEVASFQHLAS